MILIRLDSDDWLDIDDHVFHMLGPEYIIDLKDEYTHDIEEGYTDDVEEEYTDELIDMRFVFFSEDFEQCSDVIDVVGLIFLSLLSFILDYVV